MNVEYSVNLQALDEAGFLARYGGLYEHSPWIAASAWQQLSKQKSATIEALHVKFKSVVDNASQDQLLALLQAHPELAGKAAVEGSLTAESTGEQASARLDQCTKEEFDLFQQLNTQYNEKFGFPFILAVRNRTRAEILAAFKSRLNNPVSVEFAAALEQVHQIALLRLNTMEIHEMENPPAS